jgi:threonine aldolase
MAVGEAILFFDPKLAEDFDYRCKQAGQLASKMRFLAAPWVGMLESGAWLRNAKHANECARYLAQGLEDIPGVEIVTQPEANAVFVHASDEVLDAMRQRRWKFYTFIGGAARFMCSWDTNRKRIDEFCRDLRLCAEPAAMHAR